PHPVGGADALERGSFVENVAARRLHTPHDRLHRRRLARGVAPQQTDDLAGRDPVVDRFQNMKVAIMRVDGPKLEQVAMRRRGRRHARAPSPSSTWTPETSAGVTGAGVLLWVGVRPDSG